MNPDTISQEEPEVEKPKRGVESQPASDEPSYDIPVTPGPRKQKRSPSSARRRGCGCGCGWPVYLLLACMGMCCLCCVLPLCVTVAFGSTVASIVDHNKATRTETQTAQVTEGKTITLEVNNTMGNVTIEHGVENEVIVRSTMTAYGLTKGAAQDELNRVKVDVSQPNDTTVKIDVQKTKADSGVHLRASSVNLMISVPENVNLTVTTVGTGSIRVSGLQVQSMDLHSSVGTIEFTGDLPSDPSAVLNLEASVGEIKVHLPRTVSVKLDAMASLGEITVTGDFAHITQESGGSQGGTSKTWVGTLGSRTTPPTLKLRTSLGAITVDMR